MRPAPAADDARAIDTGWCRPGGVDVAKGVTRVRQFVGLGEESAGRRRSRRSRIRRLARFIEEQRAGDGAHLITLEHHERGRY